VVNGPEGRFGGVSGGVSDAQFICVGGVPGVLWAGCRRSCRCFRSWPEAVSKTGMATRSVGASSSVVSARAAKALVVCDRVRDAIGAPVWFAGGMFWRRPGRTMFQVACGATGSVCTADWCTRGRDATLGGAAERRMGIGSDVGVEGGAVDAAWRMARRVSIAAG
jgi:hypothetical protein